MIYDSIFEKEGDGSQDSATLFSMSCEFLEASIALRDHEIKNINYTIVIYYLLVHSAELALKSLINCSGASIEDLKKDGHDLEKLCAKAIELEFTDTISVSNIIEISKIYKNKALEYRHRSKLSFPDIEAITKEIECLHKTLGRFLSFS